MRRPPDSPPGAAGAPGSGPGELLTSPDVLRAAAADLRRRAAQLDEVRRDLVRRCTTAALAGVWEGEVAERFLVHVGHRHRRHHLDMAHDRLGLLALALDRAAEANEARIALHRRCRDEVEAELARRGDLASTGMLPTSLRDTSWPRWRRWVTAGRPGPADRGTEPVGIVGAVGT
jgi:hypothetical protein